MAGRRPSALALLALVAAALRLGAQALGECPLEILADGTPRFTQVLRWEADPNVLCYELILQTGSGEQLASWRLEEPTLRLQLRPGEYRYRIIAFNMLGRPELELPWRSIVVLKAEMPRITGLSKNLWFLEDLKPELGLSGENLVPGAKVVLAAATSTAEPILGNVLERSGTSKLSVGFPDNRLEPGEYSLVLTNPGGITVTVPGALSVRYLKPLELNATLGFAPWISLYDSWYVDAWPGTFFPLGSMSRFSAYFVRRPHANFGAELSFGGRFMKGGIEAASIDTQIGLLGLNGICKYPFSRSISAVLRVGGGLAMSHHQFSYGSVDGRDIYSVDPYASAGISVQSYLTKTLFLEAGSDWMHILTKDFTAGGLMPFLSAGMRL
jgi:hypothetical protein